MGQHKQTPVARECLICTEVKPIYRNFPDVCPNHTADTCLGCFTQQTVALVEEHRTWDVCTCPQCGSKVSIDALQAILPRKTVQNMKTLVEKAEHSSDQAWRWCLAPGCGYGSLQNPGKSQMIRCRKCRAKSCFTHQVPWHQGVWIRTSRL